MKVKAALLIPVVKEALDEGKVTTIKVKGHSMWPFYKDSKTEVTLEKSSYDKWDVVLALYENQYVLHRIIQKTNNGFILRGDGAIRKEVVSLESIYGKVIHYKTKKVVFEQNGWHRFKVKLWVLNPLRKYLLRLK
ncbi:MAG: S24/S26 family peptidase [Acholeplasma sp.]|nr:S24/S26 family peptidase [Acholeplasma sp.]